MLLNIGNGRPHIKQTCTYMVSHPHFPFPNSVPHAQYTELNITKSGITHPRSSYLGITFDTLPKLLHIISLDPSHLHPKLGEDRPYGSIGTTIHRTAGDLREEQVSLI